jgi:hypothetical protein
MPDQVQSEEFARRLVAFLEDRRALYAPFAGEVHEHVVESVQQIRHFLTDMLGTPGVPDALSGPLRAMRAACRGFLDSVYVRRWYVPEHGPRTLLSEGYSGITPAVFNEALGRLRGVFGVHIGEIAARYGIPVEVGLADILPPEDTD